MRTELRKRMRRYLEKALIEIARILPNSDAQFLLRQVVGLIHCHQEKQGIHAIGQFMQRETNRCQNKTEVPCAN